MRHGESEWNALGRWQGQADPPLSELGEQQARAAAERVEGIGSVVASDLQRARRTAEVIAEAIGIDRVVIEPGLRERDVGEYSGLTNDEIEARFPGYRAVRRPPPGWEHDDDFRARILAGLHRVAGSRAGGDTLVVTHGGVVYTLEDHLGLTWQTLPNLYGRWFEVESGKIEAGRRVSLLDPDDAPVTVPHQI